jgi:PIN domain nuclease of toxin-antitoxin system
MGRVHVSLILDTHAALWLVQGDNRLSERARSRIEAAAPDELVISDLLLLELAILIDRGRVKLKSDPARFLKRLGRRFLVIPVDADIASEAIALPLPQGDPFDRVFVATARSMSAELITRDAGIHESRLVSVVW